MYNCFDIADYLLKKAKEEGEGIDPMKLLKLTYIAHGYNLGFFDKPLFSNQVQAWKYGSVIPDLYQAVRMFGKNNVDPFLIKMSAKNEITEEYQEFLRKIWNKYKNLSGLQLSALTHEEGSPWSQVWDGTHDAVIENSIIEEHYKQKLLQ